MEGLKLIYRDSSVKNVLKVSWRIENTGSRGISEFEQTPMLVCPDELNVVSAKVSEKSPLLKIDDIADVDSIDRSIKIDKIGILNPNDFFQVDVYIINAPDSDIQNDYFSN